MKKILIAVLPMLPLSFILLIFSLQLSKINEELDMDNDDQLYDHEEEEEGYLKVAIVEDKAYWVVDNIFYEADVVDEEIMKDDAKPVDAFDMNFKEVNKMMVILDNIQDWKN